jgi:hypothetical protein
VAKTTTGSEDFRKAAEALRGADKELLGQLTKSMRATAKPVVGAVRAEVRKAPSKGSGGSAVVERQLHALARSGGGTKPLTERQVKSLNKRVAKMSSLRENIAAAAGSTVSTKQSGVNLTFRVRSSGLPPSQRKLVRRWNKASGWRHPVFGNRNIWVKQTGRPYFDTVITARADDLRAGVTAAMVATAERVAHPEGP